ncbi:PIR protein CIR protein [Plasmodium vinckei brucechwatti]|uniref:PIR protein CIR protein n=1 Tax=Plasmodium vinckei brucechwatti TaxID=119398 RepID=A0A6V7S5F8_PLAVN|nr:PIR protein CIR protein [Plasmodium vinckei brucechwatti]
MDDKVCDILREVDNLFTRGIVNVGKFNKSTKYHSYCPYQNGSKENKCTNDYERFNALGSYLFTKISEIDENYKKKKGVSQHIELFMIWLGSKLFKMDNDYKATLEESYKKHLGKYLGNVNYWETISKKLYKDATIRKMDELYRLLDNVCKLITEYNKNTQKPDRKSLGNHAVQCRNFYKTIHKSINGCRPYLHLLDNVKMMYENFRWYQIVDNNNLNGSNKKLLLKSIQPLETFQGENRYFISVNGMFSFDDKECKEAKSNDEQIGEQIASKKSQDLEKSKTLGRGTQIRVPGNAHRGNTGSTKLPAKPAPPHPPVLKPPELSPEKPPVQKSPERSRPPSSPQTPQKSEASHQDGTKDSYSNKGNKGDGSNISGGTVSRPESSEGKPKDTGQKKPNPVGTPLPGPKEGSQPTRLKNQGSGKDGYVVKGSQGGSGSGIDGGPGSVQGDQGKSSDGTGSVQGGQAKGPGDPSRGNPVPAQSAPASSGTGTTSSPGTTPSPVQLPSASQSPTVSQPDSSLQPLDPQKPGPQPQPPTSDPPPAQDGSSSQTGGSNNSNEPKDSGNGKGSTGGTNDNTGGSSSGNVNLGGGSSGPTSSTSEGSFNLGSSIFRFLLNGTENLKKTSEFIQKNQQSFKDSAEKISGAYNNAVDILKNAYTASNNYVNDFVKDVIGQLNKTDPPSKQNGNHSGTGNSQGGGNSPNHLPSPQPPSTTDPSQNPPSVPPKNTQKTPSNDPSHKQSLIKPPIDPSKGPSSNSLSTPPSNPTPNPTPGPPKVLLQQGQSLLQSQPIAQQPAQLPVQVNSYNQQTVGQFVKSLSSDLILKKPWNIFPTTWNGSGDCKPEIKFMNATLVCCTYEQCSLTGIPVILVLIPIILLIAYKYLSFGSSKKSEKKNMKRVINFHDGNRKTKIIISSNDRSKHLKPVINLVNGKKGPLLNIYKLIRADPMPFINLFFLLIFFVYKRKRDTIE